MKTVTTILVLMCVLALTCDSNEEFPNTTPSEAMDGGVVDPFPEELSDFRIEVAACPADDLPEDVEFVVPADMRRSLVSTLLPLQEAPAFDQELCGLAILRIGGDDGRRVGVYVHPFRTDRLVVGVDHQYYEGGDKLDFIWVVKRARERSLQP